jgi:phosphoribosylglycinamide formyltransferase-1
VTAAALTPFRVAVLVSGGGSNLQALIDRCTGAVRPGARPVEIALVISNNPAAYGLERAARAGIPTRVLDHRTFATRQQFDAELQRVIEATGVDLICLAGFMRVLTPEFVDHFYGRLVNIHPALLPAFPGLHVQQQAIDAGVRFSGATVHFVDSGVDTGPILVQAVVPILQGDTAELLAARILVQEHRIYPTAVRLLADGRVRLEGRRVVVQDPGEDPVAALLNPML